MSTFGLGYRPDYYQDLMREDAKVDFLEVISENFMSTGGRPARILAELREKFPIAMHGVGLSIASVQPLNQEYLSVWRQLVMRIQPCFVSDHLCWTQHAHKNSHDLLPPALTDETLALVADRIKQIQDYLGRQFFLENPSAYVLFANNGWDEAGFLAELVRRTGCGILLDVNNLYVNCLNLGYDPCRYLRQLPKAAVAYFHLAGHTRGPDVSIDTHDAPVSHEVWNLYTLAASIFPDAATLLERDAKLPPYAELELELDYARSRRQEALVLDSESLTALVAQTSFVSTNDTSSSQLAQNWTNLSATMFSMVEQSASIEPYDERLALFDMTRPVPARRGIQVYNDAYFVRLRDVIAGDVAALAALLGVSRFSRMIASYLASCPPTHFDIKWAGERLPLWLREVEQTWSSDWSNAALADMAAFELARVAVDTAADSESSMTLADLAAIAESEWEQLGFVPQAHVILVKTAHAIDGVWQDIQAAIAATDTIPSDALAKNDVLPTALRAVPPREDNFYLVYRYEEAVAYDCLTPAQARLWQCLAAGRNFGDAAVAYNAGKTLDATSGQAVVATLLAWIRKGMLNLN